MISLAAGKTERITIQMGVGALAESIAVTGKRRSSTCR